MGDPPFVGTTRPFPGNVRGTEGVADPFWDWLCFPIRSVGVLSEAVLPSTGSARAGRPVGQSWERRTDLMQLFEWLRKKTKSAVDRARANLVAWRYRKYGLPSIDVGDVVDDTSGVASYSPLMEDICLPPYGGAQSHDDVTPLLRIADATDPDLVVEFGTGYGNLTANICHICDDTEVITVDAPQGIQTGTLTTYQLSKKEIGRVYRQYGFEKRVTQLCENTLHVDLTEILAGRNVDLAIIDACHDTRYVLNDFNKIREHLSPNGVVLLHDTHPSASGHLAGSYAACLKLRACGHDVRHIKDSWWGVWRPKWDSEMDGACHR